jgi:hypothetical protein
VTILAVLSQEANKRADIQRLLAAGPPTLQRRLLPPLPLSHSLSPSLHIKHSAKSLVFSFTDFRRIILLDLDLILLGPLLPSLSLYPGFPPVFNANPERPERFNTGLAILRPSLSLSLSLSLRATQGHFPSWDSTDQSLLSADLPTFSLLPRSFCPKKRVIYEGDEKLRRLVRRTTEQLLSNWTSSLTLSPIHCLHWTGEKPWQAQGRPDLLSLSPLWYRYIGEHIPPEGRWEVPGGDFEAEKMKKVLRETRRQFWG